MRKTAVWAAAVVCCALLSLSGQERPVPTARLTSASRIALPGAVDSNSPMVWSLVEGTWQLSMITSWGGTPSLAVGTSLDHMSAAQPVLVLPHPGHGVWMEAVIEDEGGTWYAYYHNEAPADLCGRSDRQIPRLGAARSPDRGRSWEDLGAILEAPRESYACASGNRFVLGGVGDVSVALESERQTLYLYFSQYANDPAAQGIGVGRLAWADRDEPMGRLAVWQRGAWIPPRQLTFDDDQRPAEWEYPVGTALVPATRPWHDGPPAADAFWGPSVHWNTYLNQYVMLVNRARNENFDQDGIYVSFTSTLTDPSSWSTPQKLMNGGGWYAQVAGLETGAGTDKSAGQRARFFLTGRSDHIIEFRH